MRKFFSVLVLLCFFCYGFGQTITPATSTVCPGGIRTLTVAPTVPGTAFQWLQGPAYTPLPAFLNTYDATAPGTYYVHVFGAVPSDTIGPVTVTLATVPTASFTFAPNSIQCGNKPYTFTSTSGPGLTYLWNFGDPNSGATNNTATTSPAVHSFTGNPGIATQAMNVSLTVTNSDGCSASTTQPVTINQIPQATLISPSGSIAFQGLTYFKVCSLSPVVFTFNDASQPTVNANYEIIWGDGPSVPYNSPIAPAGVTHTYNVGNYIMQYIVLGTNGCADTTRYGVFVGSAPNGGIGTENPDLYKCTGATFSFPFLPSTFSNSIGTNYYISVDDGSAPVTYTQATLPPAFVHTFNTSSCGAGGGNNYFTVSILITNPCNIAGIPGTIGGIKISQTPVANFTVSRDTLCVNQSVTLTDNSSNQYVTENGSCSPGKSIWSVTPGVAGVDWNVVSGSLGNDNGDPLPSGWTAGSTTLQVQFLTPGSYALHLKTGGSDSCGIAQLTKTICVNALPTASFLVNQNSGCAPLTVNTTSSTNTPFCGVNKYQWTVSYVSTTGCDPAAAPVYIGGTNSTSAQPQFQFNAPGVYTIQLQVTAPGGSCVSPIATQVITVKSKPIVALNAFGPSICRNGTISPTYTATCYETAAIPLWSFPGGTPASSGSPNPAITYSTAGIFTVSLGLTNECGTTTVTGPINVLDVTQSNAGPAQTLCGSSITMAGNTALVGTGTWTQLSGPVTGVITNPSSPTTTITGLVPGSYVFAWTIDNSGCTNSSNVTINISTGPTVSIAGPDQDLCLATSATLAANTVTTGIGQWTLVSGPAGSTITNPALPGTTVTGLVVGVYTFRWTISYLNCTPSVDDVVITVFANPSVAVAGTAQTICASSTVLAGNIPAIGSGTWSQVSGPNTANIVNPSAANTTINGLITGTYTFKWKISNGPCLSTEDDVQVTVTAIPTTAVAGPDQSLCAATSAILAANTVTSGTGVWTFVSGPAGSAITNPASANSTVTGLVTGVYVFRWTISNGVCPSNTDDVQISVFANVTPSNAGPAQVICGTTALMAANTPSTGTGLWTQTAGVPATVISPTSPTTTISGLTPGNYIFTWTITNGACINSSNVNITISSGPTTANAGTDQDLCLATAATLAANTPTTGTGQWTLVSGPAGSTITNPSLPGTTVTGLVVGTYIFRWTISFSNCTPSTDDIRVQVFDNPSAAIAGPDQNICIPNAQLAANIPLIGIGSWTQLSGPNTATIANTASPATTVTGLVGGTYLFIWTINSGPCPASKDTVQIIFSTIANNVISGASVTCINTAPPTITGSLPAGSVGGYSYQWQQSTDGGASWNNIIGATSQDYSPGVLVVSTCYRRIVTTVQCNGLQGNSSTPLCITVNPDAKALFAVSSTILCAPVNLDTVIAVTTFPLQNLQYNWYQNNALIPGTTNGLPPSYVITAPGQTVVVKLVTTSPFGCKADSMSITLNTRPAVTANFIKDTASGCGPLTVNFTNTSTILNSSIEFYWDFGNGTPIVNVMQPTSPVVYLSSPAFRDTTYYITLKAYNGCDTSIKRDSVKIFANPKSRFSTLTTGCSPFRDTIINNSLGQDAFTSYYWDFGDGTLDTTFTNGTLYHTYITGVVQTFPITLITENRCGRDTQRIDVIVSPSYIQEHITINGSELYGCAPHTVNFQNSSTGASFLEWDFGDASPIETTANSQTVVSHTYLTGGVFPVSIKLRNACTDTTVIKQITVYDKPVSSFSLNNVLLCTGGSISTNNTSVNANSYEWFWGDNTSTAAFNATHVYTVGGTYLVRLVVRKINVFGVACTDTSAPVQVTVVDRIPAVVDIDPAINSCVPYDLHVSAAGAAAASQIDWYFYDSNTPPGIFHVSGPTASHIYNAAGVDSVKLVVVNAAGCKDSTVKQFTIHKTPKAVFDPVSMKTCNTDTTASFAISVDYTGTDPLSYEWFINDQLAGNSNPFSYHFQAPSGVTAANLFTIKVLVKNSFGCGDTAVFGNFIIQTLAQQKIAVSPSVVQDQPNSTFTFRDTSLSIPSMKYLWFTGDRNGTQLPGIEVTHTYGDTGTYHVKLITTDYETGCYVVDSVKVFVLYVPGYLYVPNAFCPACQKLELRRFLPLGKGLKDYHLSIFNIWGEKVFETRSIDANGIPNEPWSGDWKDGQNAQQGAFSWFIEAHYINGTEWKGMLDPKTGKLNKHGFVSIIR